MPRPIRVLLIIFAIVIAFFAGLYLGGHYYVISPVIGSLPQGVRDTLFPGDNVLQLERQIEGILQSDYYQPVSSDALENGALNGMVGSLNDPYTVYFSPDDFKKFMQNEQGSFGGIGVIVEPKDGKLTVVSTIENSPAAGAGIQPGDLIVSVDGNSIDGNSPDQIATMIRGDAGTQVTVRISRNGAEQDIAMTRQNIEVPIVSSQMMDRNGHKVGYVRLEQFSNGAGDKVKQAVDGLVSDGAEGIVFDLRNNGGGLLDEGVNVASVFIQDGPIVSLVSRDSAQQTFNARGGANTSIPLVVLVNGYTASASEIVAGAIKDDGRGKLVGEKTFGKGVVQNIDTLTNGGAIKLTTASYFTPNGTDINKIGIEPDIPVTVDPNSAVDQVLQQGLAVLVP